MLTPSKGEGPDGLDPLPSVEDGKEGLGPRPKTDGEPKTARRALKFRAWDPFNKRMYKTPFIAFEPDGTYEAYDDAREWEDCIRRNSILMQFTGLHDKHGREIYEGDQVRYKIDRILQDHIMTVDALNLHLELNRDDSYYRIDNGSVEVIGNIFEGAAGSPTRETGEAGK